MILNCASISAICTGMGKVVVMVMMLARTLYADANMNAFDVVDLLSKNNKLFL